MKKIINRKTALASSIAAAILFTGSQAQAFDFKAGEVDFEWNNHLTYGAMYRTGDPDKANTVPETVAPNYIPGQPGFNENYLSDAAQSGRVKNGNDGNLNFNKGLVQNRISVLSEFAMNYKNFGAFVRARAWYDDIYKNRSPDSWDGAALGYNDPDPTQNDEFRSDAADYLGSEAEILDAYLYSNFRFGSSLGSVKIGKQVINWGESLAFSNSINSAINPADANSGTRAGVDLKEVFMPTEAVYLLLTLTEKITMQTFYQWKHRGTVLLPSGSFFSETDMLGEGGDYTFAGPPPLASRND